MKLTHELIDVEQGEWLYKPKPKETQEEFKRNFLKRYDWLFASILILVLLVAAYFLMQNGGIEYIIELVKNV